MIQINQKTTQNNLNMAKINQKIEASLMISSYLETVGFNNTQWEFNYNEHIIDANMYLITWSYLLHHYLVLGGSNIDITGWNSSDDTILILATSKGVIENGGEEMYKKNYLDYLNIL